MKEWTRISYYDDILYLVGSVHRGSINITLTVKRSIYVNKQPGGKFQSVGPDTENNKFFEPSKLAEIFLLCFWVSSFLLSSWFKEKNKTSVSLHVIFSFIIIKGTVSLISSDPLCKDANTRFTTVPYTPFIWLIMSSCESVHFWKFLNVFLQKAQVTFTEKPQIKIISFLNWKHWYQIHTWSDKTLREPLWIGHCYLC